MRFQTYFRFSDEEFEPMFLFSGRVQLGPRDGTHVVIGPDSNDDNGGYLYIVTIDLSPPDEVAELIRSPGPDLPTMMKNHGLDAYPECYRNWVPDLIGRLDAFANTVMDAFLWRTGLQGGPLHLKTRLASVRWSEENEPAHGDFLPYQLPIGITAAKLPPTQELAPGLSDLPEPVEGSSITFPPAAHELLREAWRNIVPHPRSALLMAVAAAETAVKTLIVDLAPQTEWLIKELPSPPVDKMVKRYIVGLPVRCDFSGEVKPPPKSVQSALKRGIELRNAVVHGRSLELDASELRDLLLAIKDLLYLLDYYSGQEWALARLSNRARKELDIAA